MRDQIWKILPGRVRTLIRPPEKLRNKTDDIVSPEAVQVADTLRGNRPPAVMVYGVMPRSGSVHIGELLRLHTDLSAYPNQLWEQPFVQNSDKLLDFQESYFQDFNDNVERMGGYDFLALFGAAHLAYLQSFIASNKRLLLKSTSMRHFDNFPLIYPNEQILLLLRDGRDLVASTIRTWPNKSFTELCQTWNDNATIMLDFVTANSRPDYWLVKFEDILEDKDAFMREACERYQLDPAHYPFEKQQDVLAIGSSTLSDSGAVSWDDKVQVPKDFKPTGHWLKWSASQRKQFKRIAGDTLIRAGYAQDSNW